MHAKILYAYIDIVYILYILYNFIFYYYYIDTPFLFRTSFSILPVLDLDFLDLESAPQAAGMEKPILVLY